MSSSCRPGSLSFSGLFYKASQTLCFTRQVNLSLSLSVSAPVTCEPSVSEGETFADKAVPCLAETMRREGRLLQSPSESGNLSLSLSLSL